MLPVSVDVVVSMRFSEMMRAGENRRVSVEMRRGVCTPACGPNRLGDGGCTMSHRWTRSYVFLFAAATAVATIRPSDFPLFTITNTNSIVSGIVTDAGQIRMNFVGVTSGERTIGIGQIRTISGTDYMQMQMITGNSSMLTTHWAYMAKYDPDTFVPPSLFPDGTLLSPEWNWTDGSTWRLQSDDLFGPGGSGTFTITNYRNGYFWGPGTGPADSTASTYTQIGSITPEGNVLFNVLIGGTLTSLAGQITGTGLTGQMALRWYDGTSFGTVGYATVISVPEPSTYAMALAVLACGGCGMLRRRQRP